MSRFVACLIAITAVGIGCGRSEPPLPRSTASLPAIAPTHPVQPASSPPDELAWEGVLSEHLASGLTYINDANARDSRSAFEAVVVPDREAVRALVGGGPHADGFWTPATRQVLDAGNVILDALDRMSPGNTPVYRYILFGTWSHGRRTIQALATCEAPPWWSKEIGPSRLCHAVGSCVEGSRARHDGRRDCSFQFEYDIDSRTARRLDVASTATGSP